MSEVISKYTKAPLAFDVDGDFFQTFKLKEDRVLGAGMTGEVVLATAVEKPNVLRAVKRFSILGNDAARKKRLFCQEVGIMHKLDHPNLVKYFFSARCPDSLVICMKYYPCGTLAAKLGKMPSEDVELYFFQVACATRYIHQQRIVHCDIKLANIVIGSEKNAVLCDFGLAFEVPPEKVTVNLGKCGGTPAYKAPEQTAQYPSDYQVDPFKIDTYALGVVLWAMALKRKPNTIYDYLEEIRKPAPEPIPGAFRTWLEMLLECNPTKRATVEDLLDELRGHSVWGVLVDELE